MSCWGPIIPLPDSHALCNETAAPSIKRWRLFLCSTHLFKAWSLAWAHRMARKWRHTNSDLMHIASFSWNPVQPSWEQSGASLLANETCVGQSIMVMQLPIASHVSVVTLDQPALSSPASWRQNTSDVKATITSVWPRSAELYKSFVHLWVILNTYLKPLSLGVVCYQEVADSYTHTLFLFSYITIQFLGAIEFGNLGIGRGFFKFYYA